LKDLKEMFKLNLQFHIPLRPEYLNKFQSGMRFKEVEPALSQKRPPLSDRFSMLD
jgi:hypothetical protein